MIGTILKLRRRPFDKSDSCRPFLEEGLATDSFRSNGEKAVLISYVPLHSTGNRTHDTKSLPISRKNFRFFPFRFRILIDFIAELRASCQFDPFELKGLSQILKFSELPPENRRRRPLFPRIYNVGSKATCSRLGGQ